MRKFLSTFFLLILVATMCVCTSCDNYSFDGKSVLDVLDEIANDADVVFLHEYNSTYQSETIYRVAYDNVSIENNYSENSYLTYYVNIDDVKYTDYSVDFITYGGEKYYLTAVTLEKLPAKEGLKVLFVQTVWSGDFSSSAIDKDSAILFTLPNDVKATDLY